MTPLTAAQLERQLQRVEQALARSEASGKAARRAEAENAVDSGIPTLRQMLLARATVPDEVRTHMYGLGAALVLTHRTQPAAGVAVPFWRVVTYTPDSELPAPLQTTLRELRQGYLDDVAWSEDRDSFFLDYMRFGKDLVEGLVMSRIKVFEMLVLSGDVEWSRFRKTLWEQTAGEWTLRPEWRAAAEPWLPVVDGMIENFAFLENWDWHYAQGRKP